MSANSKISWCDASWNPIIGCSKTSEGCRNCYAEKMAKRLASINMTSYYLNVVKCKDYATPQAKILPEWNGKTHFVKSALEKPFKWKKHRMIFVCSMGDLFHESLNFKTIRKVFDIMRACPQHTFQILTKRPKRMLDFYLEYYGFQNEDNIWLGVTAENQEQANIRIPILLQIPAKVRFISVEPMLSKVSLHDIESRNGKGECIAYYQVLKPITGCGGSNRPALDWVICGGESGPKARPIKAEWVRLLKDQCERFNVPFFFKQWNKKADGSLLNGKEYKQFPKI